MTTKNRASTDWLVVHCSATPGTMDIGRAEIDRWHRQKGWLMIGYHFVIRRNGKVEIGRPVDTIGAHVEGHNSVSIGICMVGGTDAKGAPEDNFTSAQYAALAELLRDLKAKYPRANICGHRDFSPDKNKDGKITPNEFVKACPSFDVHDWLVATAVLPVTPPKVNPPKTAKQGGWAYHQIVAGDTLFSLARTYAVSADTIVALNPGVITKALKVGAGIRVR
ncbi:MAG: N-acetylmuramoyl-L-alanine amidase [Devosia sp.]|uniref:N-acetylmuramoyl-L-alanine amidase n=1 Tax=Devosia sp. 66-22 TaxID=1895753 RepID=UPI0009296F39|nr:N-acetylmuramoyl-L-alanine amidase [Devosia sp. 66-22]MBN9346632.1 N-acetylmuramoyl-L-alanine amidase [Devosia sp.]OJX54711.1 MAG: hypothetical protein BGO81_16455 [Devosia sp. 66-22]